MRTGLSLGAARKMGIADRITILGVRDDVAELLPGLDACAQSSAWGEAFSLSLGEAMACGIPSVATDVGDTALLLGKEGFLVRPRDPDALALSILQIFALNAEERAALGLRSRQRVVDNFSLGHYVDRHLELYAEILAGGRRHQMGGSHDIWGRTTLLRHFGRLPFRSSQRALRCRSRSLRRMRFQVLKVMGVPPRAGEGDV